jgi:hypothetical protein
MLLSPMKSSAPYSPANALPATTSGAVFQNPVSDLNVQSIELLHDSPKIGWRRSLGSSAAG